MAQVGVGLLLSLIGFAVQGTTIAEFRKSNQQPSVKAPTTTLITAGLYQYSRNPMYLGAALIHLGVGISTGSIWVLVTCILAITMVHFLAILPEEAYLDRKFGAEYRTYQASVRRWL